MHGLETCASRSCGGHRFERLKGGDQGEIVL